MNNAGINSILKALMEKRLRQDATAQAVAEADCQCIRCTSLRAVKNSLDEQADQLGSSPWRWFSVVTKENGKTVGACIVEARLPDEAVRKALEKEISAGGDEYEVMGMRLGFVPFGRWTGRPLSKDEWERITTGDPKDVGVQLDV